MAGPPPSAPSGRTHPGPVAGGGGLVGRVLDGRYRLVGQVGAGASAVVYVAEDVRLRREVAVKVLHQALAADPAFLRRFEAEAQLAAGLRHPNLLAVHDWGEEDGLAYLVTEHLEAGSLRGLLDRGFRASPSQVLLLGLQAARALDHAHRRGLVHRDVKPANLLFDADGRLRVADFGLARAIAESAVTEPMGALLGTARYASPEQAEGRPLDGRSDVYSLGLVLIEALTGRVPFSADTSAATLLARVGRAVAPPPEAGPLTDALMSVGRPKPVDRPDAATFAQLLKACAADLPPPAPLPLARVGVAGRARRDPEDATVLPAPAARPTTPLTEEAPPVTGSGRKSTDGPFDVDADDAAAADLVDGRSRVVIDDVGPLADLDAPGDDGRARPGRWRRRLSAVLLSVVVLAAAGLVWTTKPWLSTVEVPNVRGVTVEEATTVLAAQHLRARPGPRRHDEDLAQGLVLDTVQEEAKEDSTVALVVSEGPAPRKVPDLAGRPLADAQDELAKVRLAAKAEPRDHETAPEGTVIETIPATGAEAPRDSTVVVVVSAGPPPRAIPDVAGKPYDQAAAALAALGFAPTRAEAFNDTVAVGAVVSTSPGAAALLKPGKGVTVTVSKGPDLVVVPSVTGRTPAEAQSIAQANGLAISATYGPPGGKVFDTDPKQGTKVKRGTSIALYTR